MGLEMELAAQSTVLIMRYLHLNDATTAQECASVCQEPEWINPTILNLLQQVCCRK